ncbi:MAG TPA: sulfatase [Candidatus Acidoferrales bacterium]|nr:sulfatase [Candidatus Acidoferrales bacterium]
MKTGVGRGISAPRAGSGDAWQTVCVSAWFGLMAGLVEGILDLTVNHFHAPAILGVSVLFDLCLFVALGGLAWVVARTLRRRLPASVLLPLLSGILVYGWARTAAPREPEWEALIPAGSAAVIALLAGIVWPRQTAGFARKALPWTAAVAAACLIGIPVYGAWAERQARAALPAISPAAPNVLLVIVDTLRADRLSGYGYGRSTSPNIDRLAREGVAFDAAIAVSSWTLPSHASMMTGVYPDADGVETVSDQLRPRTLTLPWAMREGGYRTAAFSANMFLFNRRVGLGQGFMRFGDFFFTPADAIAQIYYVSAASNLLSQLGWERNLLGRESAAGINRAALAWIASDRRPFFLVLNYFDVHDPYLPPQPYRDMFSHRDLPGPVLNIGENIFPQLTPAEIANESNAYDGAIRYADAQLGNLLEELSRRCLLRNTLLIVTSDHGEAFGEHGLVDHANALYFPLIHVPLVFRWPGHIPPGVRVAQPVSTKDIGATALALLGLRQTGLPGRSLEPLWTGGTRPERWPAPISELAQAHFARDFPNYYGPLESVVTRAFQYIVDPRLGPLLYDWPSDPAETRNLVRQDGYRAAARALAATFAAASRSNPVPARIRPTHSSPARPPKSVATDQ